MKIELRTRDGAVVKCFASKERAGAWLRSIGWPRGLVYAPDADRVDLAQVLLGSPWLVLQKR